MSTLEQALPQTPTAAAMPVALLRGVGPRTLENLALLNIRSVQDLLFHLPARYQDRTQISPMRSLRAGQFALVEGELSQARLVQARRASLVCQLSDGTSLVKLRFFHFSAAQLERFKKPGFKLCCFGEVRATRQGLEMIHPEWREIKPGENLILSERLTPIYPATKGLQQTLIRKLINQALEFLREGRVNLEEYLPREILAQFKFPSLHEAILFLHAPPVGVNQSQLLEGVHPMQQRLAFEELLAHHLALLELRSRVQANPATPLRETKAVEVLLSQLSFQLTAAQTRVWNEIQQDLLKAKPMLRLVQGDVGSGKTIVAALAILQAAASGFQAALMAPTELLAEQHSQNLRAWFASHGVQVALLTSSVARKERQQILAGLAEGSIQVAVGTHALFQAEVEFASLKLLVIDEQHRFGVHHRLSLQQKGEQAGFYPHQLVMTATPIPRTLTMSAYADLDSSIIDELPPGRQSITTALVSSSRRAETIERLREHCRQAHQAYWVCTLIAESEVLQAQAAELTTEQLLQALPEFRIALMHGRLGAEEKARLMRLFKLGEIDLLVATTVIEVGVDVPNASLMVIENPERLGLAQLHQLRGRVGRGAAKSYCVLLYQQPLSESARKRLSIMRASQNGFVIAQHDLEMRGPGELLGTRQAGLMSFKIADLMRDKELLSRVALCATSLIQQRSGTITHLIKRWLEARSDYAKV